MVDYGSASQILDDGEEIGSAASGDVADAVSEHLVTPQPTQHAMSGKTVKFEENKESEKVPLSETKKMEEMFKVNAEIEFFLLTCIAVKSNLVEEFPDKPEVMTEDAMRMYKEAQREHVSMAKFSLWIEFQLRQKYDLPKLQGFKKFMEKYGLKDKLERGKNKGKSAMKSIGVM